MKKIKISSLAKELGVNLDKLVKLKTEKLVIGQFSGTGKLAWLTPEGADILRLAAVAPLAVPNKLYGKGILAARNPRWIYAKIEGLEGKFPVAIPNRLKGVLVGKRFGIDAITDASGGTTYRHEALGK